MKYDIWFCECGRIHFMPKSYIEWLCQDTNRSIIQVCQHCGNTMRTNLSKSFNGGFDVNRSAYYNSIISDTKDTRIILNRGICVPVISDECYGYAEHYNSAKWYDANGNETKVDTQLLIESLENLYDGTELLKSISCYYSGIDWSGTQYDNC